MPNNQFSAETLRKLGEKYNLFTHSKITETIQPDAFNNYAKNRAADFNVFKETKGADGTTPIHKSLIDKDNDNKKAVRTAIADAFKSTTAFTDAQKSYNKTLEEINTGIKNGTPDTAIKIIEDLTTSVFEAGKAILIQQKAEKDALDKLFTDPTFKDNLEKSIGINSEERFNEVKENMQADLKSSHVKQLEEFDKSTCDSLVKIHNTSSDEKRRLYFMATLHNNNETMQKIIDEKIKQNKNIKNTQVTIRQDENNQLGIDLSGVEFNPGEHFSLTGTQYYANIFNKGGVTKIDDKSYQIEFDNYVSINSSYYLSPTKKVELDLETLAFNMLGQKDIVITVEFDDPKLATLRAQQAYEAFIKMGHDPKNIIEIRDTHGKVYKVNPDSKNEKELSVANDLFKNHQGKYAEIEKAGKAVREDFKNLGIISKTQDEIKTENIALRNKAAPPENAPTLTVSPK